MNEAFKCGDIEVSPELNSVIINAQSVRLTLRETRLLVLLAEQHPKPASKQSIIETVWQNRAGAEELVARLVADLRKKLGDSASKPQYIETIAKRGYRLIPKVEMIQNPSENDSPNPSKKAWQVNLLLLLVLVISVLAIWQIWPSQSTQHSTHVPAYQFKKTRLVASLHQERRPRFSPSGKFVFSENYDPGLSRLAMTHLDSLDTSYFSHDELDIQRYFSPLPSDNQVLYGSWDGSQCLFRLHDFVNKQDIPAFECDIKQVINIDWIDQGQHIVYNGSVKQATQTLFGLNIIDPVSGATIHTLLPDNSDTIYFAPRTSPQQTRVVAIQYNAKSGLQHIVIWHPGEQQISHSFEIEGKSLTQVVWRSSDSLLYSTFDGIYNLPIDSGQSHKIYSGQIIDFDYHQALDSFATSEGDWNVEVFRRDGDNRQATNLTQTTAAERSPYVSKNGAWISYASDKHGHVNLFQKDLSSGVERKLTDFTNLNIVSYYWSIDENKLVVNLSDQRILHTQLIDVLSGDTVKMDPQVIYGHFDDTDDSLYLAKQQGERIVISNNNEVRFTLPQGTKLFRFHLYRNTLYYQSSFAGPLFSQNAQGVTTQLDFPDPIYHWYIQAEQLYFSAQTDILADDSSRVFSIFQWPLQNHDNGLQIVAENLKSGAQFYYDSDNQQIYYASSLAEDKTTLFLLQPQ